MKQPIGFCFVFILTILITLVSCGMQSRPRLQEVGGVELVFQAQTADTDKAPTKEQLESARSIIEGRLRELGVSEPAVLVEQDNQIVVELPSTTDLSVGDATRLVMEKATLEFIDGGSDPPLVGDVVATDLGSTGSSTPIAKVWKTIISNADIDGSAVKAQESPSGGSEIYFALKGEGPKKLAEYTAANVGRYMPIVLDKKVISTPIIMEAITGGAGVISVSTLKEAKNLAAQLKHGELPVKLQLLKATTVPTQTK